MEASRLSLTFILAAAGVFCSRCSADLRLPGVFTDNLVLQQGVPAPIWGWADDGEEISVHFRDQTVKTTSQSGKWMVRLTPLKAGGPDLLTVEGKNRLTRTNVLVGEVWICSGQSNMGWPLQNSSEAEAEIAASANPNLHLLLVPPTKANAPLDDVKSYWAECNPQTSGGFSAVAYYFGRDLQKSRHVPVGLIETCWGGSPAEVWISQDVLESNPDYKRDILEAYAAAVEKAEKSGKKKQIPGWKPTELYNAMIAPLIPYAIKGAIWYQGESNAGRAHQYRTLYPDLIRNWRRDWGQGEFTFLGVQLAPFQSIQPEPRDSAWAELREAQLLATRVLPNVGMAVITDVGDEKDIHPKRKAPVGGRLAMVARGIAYGEKIEFSGPLYRELKIQGDRAILSFDHLGDGLETRGGQLTGFAICGADRRFVWAHAAIEGENVVVSSPEVAHPVAVRFGWADFPVVNLWNKAGLPATPFRTDDFPLTTAPKH